MGLSDRHNEAELAQRSGPSSDVRPISDFSESERRVFDAAFAGVKWADTVVSESITWLWKPLLPSGKVTLLEGDPGQGKSWISLAIAADLSAGRALPGGFRSEPARVMFCSAEDGVADTLSPRLQALNAQTRAVAFSDEPIVLDDEGFERLAQGLAVVRPQLMVLDPLVAFLGSRVDFYRANETREVMARLANLAADFDTAILAIRHLTKSENRRVIYRGLGSIDLTASARSVLLAGGPEAEATEKALFQIKNNLAPLGGPYGYRLDGSGFTWLPETQLTLYDIVRADSSTGDDRTEEAKEFLREALSAGSKPVLDILEEADLLGIAQRTLKRAKASLGVKAEKKGFGSEGFWTWGF